MQTMSCISIKLMILSGGEVRWTEYYVPLEIAHEVIPAVLEKHFQNLGDLKEALDALAAHPHVARVVYDSALPESTYMQYGGVDQPKMRPERPEQIPFPAGMRVCAQHTAVFKC